MGLRPKVVSFGRDKASLDVLRIELRHRTVGLRFISRPASPGLVCDVDRVALPQEELRPAVAAVGGPAEVRAGLPASMDHDDRPGVCLLTWNLKLDIQLAAY